jgi:hypothetical protein
VPVIAGGRSARDGRILGHLFLFDEPGSVASELRAFLAA